MRLRETVVNKFTADIIAHRNHALGNTQRQPPSNGIVLRKTNTKKTNYIILHSMNHKAM